METMWAVVVLAGLALALALFGLLDEVGKRWRL